MRLIAPPGLRLDSAGVAADFRSGDVVSLDLRHIQDVGHDKIRIVVVGMVVACLPSAFEPALERRYTSGSNQGSEAIQGRIRPQTPVGAVLPMQAATLHFH